MTPTAAPPEEVNRSLMHRVMNDKSSILAAMEWMSTISFVLTILLGWVAGAGLFIGPLVGGYIGGRRAGTPVRALVAAILPAIVLPLLIAGLVGVFAAHAHSSALAALGAVAAGVLALYLLAHDLLLFLAAGVGGWMRQREG